MTKLRCGIPLIIGLSLLCFPMIAWSQATGQQGNQQNTQGGQQGPPLAPVSAEEPSQPAEGGRTPSEDLDARSFGGVEGFSVQRSGLSRGYFIPSIQFSAMGDSNFNLSPGNSSIETIETIVGRLDYKLVGRHAQTTLEYLGGGTIYNRHSNYNNTMQQFGITESYQGRRWSFTFDDRASYLPESSFGFGGFGYMGALGIGLGGATGSNLTSLDPSLNPESALMTGRGSRVFNNSTVQVQYLAGARSSITMAASYGFLHFTQPGLVGFRNGTAMLGFSHSLTARDYIGLNYQFGVFQFPSAGTSFDTNIVQLSYGHRISGRMAMDVGAGPEIDIIRRPVTGTTTPISWSAHTSLDYRPRRGDLLLSFYRYTTSGGGLLTGATTDSVSLSWTAQLVRRWTGSIGPGYAYNKSIPQTAASKVQSTFNSAFMNASLSHEVGRTVSMFLTYTFQTQSTSSSPCSFATCGASFQRHMVGFGFDFHPRQISVN